MMYYNDVDKNQHPVGFFDKIKAEFGDLKDEATFKKWAKNLFDKTLILDDNKWAAFIAKPDANILQADPAFDYGASFAKNYTTKYAPLFTTFTTKITNLVELI